MALTKVTSDGITDGTIIGTDLATNVDLIDNKKIRFGTGNDLEIYHDGSNSYLDDDGTGALLIRGSTVRIRKNGTTENMISCAADGAVELYYDNVKKFETQAQGTKFHGTRAQFDDNVKIAMGTNADLEIYHDGTNNIIDDANSAKIKIQRGGSDVWELKSTGLQGIDNQKLMLGTSDDLQIYHDGSNSYILNAVGSGQLTISSDNALNLASRTGTEYFFRAYTNGGAELYYDNSKKFETTNLGAQITGELSLTTHLKLLDDQKVVCGNAEDLLIFHDGTHSRINNSTGYLTIKSDQLALTNGSGDHDYITVPTAEQNVRLHYDNAVKFETTSDGALVSGHLNFPDASVSTGRIRMGASDDLQIYHSGDDSFIKDTGTGGLRIDTDQLIVRNAAGSSPNMEIKDDGRTFIPGAYNETTSGSVNLRVLSDGQLKRSTSSIRYKKDVTDATWGLTEVLKLKPKTFKNNATGENADDKTYGGFTAEDIHDLGLTEFVDYNEKNEPDALAYGNMVALMAKAIQELNAKVAALEAS